MRRVPANVRPHHVAQYLILSPTQVYGPPPFNTMDFLAISAMFPPPGAPGPATYSSPGTPTELGIHHHTRLDRKPLTILKEM